jgi:hypothetical protein
VSGQRLELLSPLQFSPGLPESLQSGVGVAILVLIPCARFAMQLGVRHPVPSLRFIFSRDLLLHGLQRRELLLLE